MSTISKDGDHIEIPIQVFDNLKKHSEKIEKLLFIISKEFSKRFDIDIEDKKILDMNLERLTNFKKFHDLFNLCLLEICHQLQLFGVNFLGTLILKLFNTFKKQFVFFISFNIAFLKMRNTLEIDVQAQLKQIKKDFQDEFVAFSRNILNSSENDKLNLLRENLEKFERFEKSSFFFAKEESEIKNLIEKINAGQSDIELFLQNEKKLIQKVGKSTSKNFLINLVKSMKPEIDFETEGIIVDDYEEAEELDFDILKDGFMKMVDATSKRAFTKIIHNQCMAPKKPMKKNCNQYIQTESEPKKDPPQKPKGKKESIIKTKSILDADNEFDIERENFEKKILQLKQKSAAFEEQFQLLKDEIFDSNFKLTKKKKKIKNLKLEIEGLNEKLDKNAQNHIEEKIKMKLLESKLRSEGSFINSADEKYKVKLKEYETTLELAEQQYNEQLQKKEQIQNELTCAKLENEDLKLQIEFLIEKEKAIITYIPKPCLKRVRTCETPTTLKRGQKMLNEYLNLIRLEKMEKGRELSNSTLKGVQRNENILRRRSQIAAENNKKRLSTINLKLERPRKSRVESLEVPPILEEPPLEKRKSQIILKKASNFPLPRSSTSKTPETLEKKVEQKRKQKQIKDEKPEKEDKIKTEKPRDKEYEDFYQKVFIKLKKDEGKKRKILKLFRDIAKHGEGDEIFLKKIEEEIEIFLNLKQAARQEKKEKKTIVVQKENAPTISKSIQLETLESEYFNLETVAKIEKETERKEKFKPVSMKLKQSIRQITQKEKIMNNTFQDTNNTNTNTSKNTNNTNNNLNMSSSKDMASFRDEKARTTKKMEDIASKSMHNLRSEKKIKIKQTIKEEEEDDVGVDIDVFTHLKEAKLDKNEAKFKYFLNYPFKSIEELENNQLEDVLIEKGPNLPYDMFSNLFKRLLKAHEKCGAECPHIKRFYARIGYFRRKKKQNKHLLYVSKQEITQLPRLDL